MTLFYLVLFAWAVEPARPLLARVVYGLTAVALPFGWYALAALFVSHEAAKDRFRAVARQVERTTGAVLVALGVRLAFSRRVTHPGPGASQPAEQPFRNVARHRGVRYPSGDPEARAVGMARR